MAGQAGGNILRGPSGGGPRFAQAARARQGARGPAGGARAGQAPKGANSLWNQAVGITNATLNPVIAGLTGQIGQNNQQTTGALNTVGGYYQGLGQQAQSGVNQETGIANDLNSQLAGIGKGEQSQLQGIGQNALASLAKYAPQSDAAHSLMAPAAGSLATEIARQQGLAAQDQGAFQKFGATQGANYRGMAASNLGTFAKAGQESLGNIAQAGAVRNEPLTNRLASTIASRGADIETAYGRLQQQQTSNQIARAGLGIKSETARTGLINAQTNRINAGTRQKALGVTSQNNLANQAIHQGQLAEKTGNDAATQAWHQASLNAKRTAAGGQPKPLSGSAQTHLYGQLNQAISLVQTGLGKHVSPAQIKADLGAHFKMPDLFTEVAFELVRNNGYISRQTALGLHNLGLRGGTYSGQPIKVFTPPNGQGNSTRGHG